MAVTNGLPFLSSIYSISTLIITLGMAIGNVFTHISVKMWIHQFLFDSPHILQRVAPNYPQQIIIMVAFSLTFYATQKQKEAHHISTASASIGFHLNDCQRPIRGFEERTTSHFIYIYIDVSRFGLRLLIYFYERSIKNRISMELKMSCILSYINSPMRKRRRSVTSWLKPSVLAVCLACVWWWSH